jgi:hypothetical protein
VIRGEPLVRLGVLLRKTSRAGWRASGRTRGEPPVPLGVLLRKTSRAGWRASARPGPRLLVREDGGNHRDDKKGKIFAVNLLENQSVLLLQPRVINIIILHHQSTQLAYPSQIHMRLYRNGWL